MATDNNFTIVEYFDGNEGHRCGYCGSSNTNYSHGMWAHSMTVKDYEDLVSRGWRRSGAYCYKPTLNIACCPMQTIRMDAPNFSISKSQKKVIKMVNRYLIHGIKRVGHSADGQSCDGCAHHHEDELVGKDQAVMDTAAVQLKGCMKQKLSPSSSSTDHETTSKTKTSQSENEESGKNVPKLDVEKNESRSYKPGVGPDPNKPKCRKAKLLRLEKKQKKISHESPVSSEKIDGSTSDLQKVSKKESEAKSLEDYLNEPENAQSVAHKLEVQLVQSCPMSREFVDRNSKAHKIYVKYQTTIHGDPPSKPNAKQYRRFLVDSPLKIKLVCSCPPSEEFLSTFASESHTLFKKYQMSIHKEPENDCTLRDFSNFLVKSPLKHTKGKLPMGYGSFHQHYILDGKMIAVGVIDILPHSVSSVYLYYDPDYWFLSLGTYSALREIAFVRELNKMVSELRYYNMGFYIHSCPKMRYKGQFSPSFIACPEVHTWVPIEKCRPKMDAARYCRFEEDTTIEDEEGKIDVNEVLVLQDGEVLQYGKYHLLNPGIDDAREVEQYAKLVGRTCAQRMLLYRR